MIKLSVVIITYNEATNIERCINSVKPIADEILVVDSFSLDSTPDICKKLGVRFIQNSFVGHIEQKNFAMQKAANDYILSLDADEALSHPLIEAIAEAKVNWVGESYSLNRLTSYCGKWIKTCGWYPDVKIRLWDRRKGQWGGENPHDKVVLLPNSLVTHINSDLLHYSFPTIGSHVVTANNFSTIAAREAYLKGKRTIFFWHILLNPLFTFVQKYFFKLGFTDGFYGLVIAAISAFTNFLKYTKLRELNRQKKASN